MIDFNIRKLERPRTILRPLPYAVFGALAFYLTSVSNLNSFWSIYVVLLEAKLAIALVYFLKYQLNKSSKKSEF